MTCPKCGSQQVTVELIQTAGKTARHGTGFGGKLNNTARAIAALSTLGVSNLFWKKSKGTEKTRFVTEKICLCQSCGHSWPMP